MNIGEIRQQIVFIDGSVAIRTYSAVQDRTYTDADLYHMLTLALADDYSGLSGLVATAEYLPYGSARVNRIISVNATAIDDLLVRIAESIQSEAAAYASRAERLRAEIQNSATEAGAERAQQDLESTMAHLATIESTEYLLRAQQPLEDLRAAVAELAAGQSINLALDYVLSECRECTVVPSETGLQWAHIESALESAQWQYDYDSSCWQKLEYIGTTLGIMPSGKIYALWTSNQTEADMLADSEYSDMLEAEISDHGYCLAWYDDSAFIAVTSDTLPDDRDTVDSDSLSEYDSQQLEDQQLADSAEAAAATEAGL